MYGLAVTPVNQILLLICFCLSPRLSEFGVGIFFLIATFPNICLLVPFIICVAKTKALMSRAVTLSDLRLAFRIGKIRFTHDAAHLGYDIAS